MNVSSKPSTHKAAGQYLGYSEQEARFCYHLLVSPEDAQVVMEGEDDVAIRHATGDKVLEQVKSATKHNALSDWSTDLWKTIGNWLADIESGAIDLHHTQFRIYVTPSQTGTVANSIHVANDKATADKTRNLIYKARDLLAQKPKCNQQVQALLNLGDTKFVEFLSRISIESIHARPEHSVENLWGPSYREETKQKLTNYAIGLARDKANKLIKLGDEGVVGAGAFRKEIQLFAARLNLPNFLASTSPKPAPEAVASVHSQRPVFVRQLEIIDIGQDQEIRAVADYLRASADKTIWAEEGDIVQRDLEDWETSLISTFDLHRGEVQDLHAEAPVEARGRQLLRLCLRSPGKLAGQEVPDHFVPGSYHELADQPWSGIGWHPDYKTIISEG